jgi:hypothetical protein
MSGNVFEWVADRYRADYYTGSPADNPIGPNSGDQRSVRSSGFDSGGNQAPVFTRFFNRPENQRSNLGFRCVVEDPTYFAPFCNYPAVYGTDGVGGPDSGAQIDVDCPTLSINQDPGCDGTTPVTDVTLAGPAGSSVTVPEPACSALSAPGNTTCTDFGQVSICSECTITTTAEPQCPDGYTYNPETESCDGNFGAGTCLPGFVVGPLTRGNAPAVTPPPAGLGCCTLPPLEFGEPTRGGIFPFCPAGTYYDGQGCISVEVVAPYCKSEAVGLNSCQPGGGGPVECNLSSSSCSYPNCTFDPKTCSCLPDPSCG